MKCLVADDNADLARLWALALEGDGHDVTVCTDGDAAVNQMRVQDFDLLILDLFMPGGGALALARVAVYNNPAAQVLVVTGADCFAFGELLEMGDNIAMVLRKPVSPTDLRSYVAHLAQKAAGVRAEAMQSKDFAEVDRLKAALVAAGVEVRMSKAGVELVPGAGFDAAKLEEIA